MIFPSRFNQGWQLVLFYLAIGSNFNLEYVFSSSSILHTFVTYCALSITTMARPLSSGRMTIVLFLPSDFKAFLSSLFMLD